ncbi:MAG: site-specific DNA-methyltransferase [Syntrophothermus sp.]|nr:site-specific DNA-methyltransferase [Syntrophothermus sp.]
MFPVDFALKVVTQYTQPGDMVLDPFAGRGTTVAAAAALNRCGFGVEINPVGWLYGAVKLAPADVTRVLQRLEDIAARSSAYAHEASQLPEFYLWCFAPGVRQFLLAAREHLRWKDDPVDATLMAFILLYLQGKRGEALSNQMRQQKSMAPAYSVRWWKVRDMKPPEIDPVSFLVPRIRWRYALGTLHPGISEMLLGDSRELLLARQGTAQARYQLLLTSPPYYGLTSYYYDHWLRYWLLGGPELPSMVGEAWVRESRHNNQKRYRELLQTVFAAAAEMMAPDATIYVRTDARDFTRQVTEEILGKAFPRKRIHVQPAPFRRRPQTALFGDPEPKPGEVDLILTN